MPAGCSSRSWPPPDRGTARLRAAASVFDTPTLRGWVRGRIEATAALHLGVAML